MRPAATAIFLALLAQPAAALTPEESWEGWQALAAAAGQTITATGTQKNGDTLSVTGITVSVPLPEGPAMTATIPQVDFRDRGDGSVDILYPPSYDVIMAFPPEIGDGPTSMKLTIGQTDLSVIASGTVDAPRFDFTAAAISVVAGDFVGHNDKPVDLSVTAVMSDASGSYQASPAGSAKAYDSQINAKAVSITLEGSDPAGADFSGSMAIADLATNGKTVMVDPALLQSGDMSAALAAGFMVDAAFKTGPITLNVKANDQGQAHNLDLGLTGSAANVFLDANQLDYGFGLNGGTVTASGFDMPFPQVASAFGEIALGFAMPVKASDQPQDFSALVRLVDLTLDDAIWNMFDPGTALKRDPVTLIVDLDGTGAWTIDIMDPAAQMQAGPDLPAKLYTLDLTEVLARFMGAQVAAEGGLTFDNDNLQALGGVPAPTGKITVTMDGINALLDALVAIGLVPENDMMGARMGLAMFARPGANPDQLISDIEFKAGSLFVNGQQMF